jgi:hypothetical protein
MAFGICGRNKNCRASLGDAKNSYQESRKPGIIVEALVPNAWRLAETLYSFHERRYSLILEIDPAGRWSQLRPAKRS